MNDEQRKAIIAEFERLNGVVLTLRDLVFADELQGGTGAQPERLLFCSPCTGQIETGSNIWGGAFS